jgi:hypothetical protein
MQTFDERGIMMKTFEELRGRTIEAIYIDEHEHQLLFETEDGPFIYTASGDCCNTVWFAHITLPPRLDGSFVMSIESKDWRKSTAYMGGDDAEEEAFWTLLTSNGYIDIEVRNSHNGYYGGDVALNSTGKFNMDTARKITEDF